MELNQRFTILTFPQFFDGSSLRVNVVFLPRNQNPLMPAIESDATIPDAPAFADAKLSFVAKIISGLSGMPITSSAAAAVALTTMQPTMVRPLFDALANQFNIKNKGALNTNANINASSMSDGPGTPRSLVSSVKKYLPVSYRQSFNFIAPQSPGNGVIDDSYACAVRDAVPNPAFVQSPDEITWGQVFASAMRQPQLAQALGMIYQTQFPVDAAYFPKGGWLYIDLADDSDYKAQEAVDNAFIKHYATRIPFLKIGKSRSVFGAIQFPVLPTVPSGNYDEIFIEAADFDDGFAKIVHAFQPVSNNLLVEESDGFHPTKEVGIRLGWDDEQILNWYIRQLAEDSSVGPMQRIDSPIGAFGYKIDVREKASPALPWQSLNMVSSKAPLSVVNPVTKQVITLGDFTDKELGYQVYPAQLDGDDAKSFWLPMYFAAWSGKSMVLPDEDAAEVYQNTDAQPNPATNVTGAPQNNLNKVYNSTPIATALRYGKFYQFRIRLGDMSGGGPEVSRDPEQDAPSQVADCHFKRFVAPSTVRIDGLPSNTDDILFADTKLTLKRPLLGYPSVVFTDKYADPISLLKKASRDMAGKEAFGIADPDVDSVEITIELQTLKMDNLMSVSGREAYIKFYTVTRRFPKESDVFEDELLVPLRYKDCKVLNFGDPGNLGDLGVNQTQLEAMDELVLPTARVIRLTIRPVCEEKPDYYGLEQPDHAFNTRYGRTIQFQLHQSPLEDETILVSPGDQIRGIYLQPDPPFVFDGNVGSIMLGKEIDKSPDMIQRLAQQLGVESNGLSLVAKKGQRVQFGCSNRIRHTLSPDNSSITFASKADLSNHWLCSINLRMERDWTWDALEDRSFVIQRKKRFKEDDLATETETLEVGDIELKRTAPFTALINPDRSFTTVIFIDAVETKNALTQPAPDDTEPRFPDLIELGYTIQPKFKKPLVAQTDGDYELTLELPITVPPAQVPKIVSAGIALSPYVRNKTYSETEPRRRFLWIEFDAPVRDPKDTYFARVLSYAPDQLISNNSPELLIVPDEPSLPIDPEQIRVITPNQSNDDAGLDAMQPMEKSNGLEPGSDRFYLLPLPSGLHAESAEMFGFFTYEIRVGHYQYTDTTTQHIQGEHVWTTAQGRFGRSLKVPGIQYPAPTLTCIANRDEAKLYVSAPYAIAVHQGKNVTADLPRTEIWALLYAQVKQADNTDFRNILLNDRLLNPAVRVEHRQNVDWNVNYTVAQRNVLRSAVFQNFRDDLNIAELGQVFQLVETANANKDATKYGAAVWSNKEIFTMLARYGLPPDSPLSVLCVEMLPHITNVFEHVSSLDREEARSKMRETLGSNAFLSESDLQEGLAAQKMARQSIQLNEDRPLSNQLGDYRILRTSPLTAVPFFCYPE
jgi:hypothetical protein